MSISMILIVLALVFGLLALLGIAPGNLNWAAAGVVCLAIALLL